MCSSYSVDYVDNSQKAKVRLVGSTEEQVREVVISFGETGYVMNEYGFTVDVIKTNPK